MTKHTIFFLCLIFSLSVNAQDRLAGFKFIENKGQWDSKVEYKADIQCGNLYLQNDGFVFDLYDGKEFDRYVKAHHNKASRNGFDFLKKHAYQVSFLNKNADCKITTQSKTPEYYNYFLGKDRSKWGSKAYGYHNIKYEEIYPNIDLKLYTKGFNLKYDFVVAPNANPSEIKVQYDGMDKIFIRNEKLFIQTSVNQIIENKPYSYQIINGEKVEVKCQFKLTNNILSFDLPDGYDSNSELIIDPTLIFSTYSGSTSNNFGYSATFDSDGFLYSGSSAFGQGYPSTLGAYDVSFGGGFTDVGISKFDTTGTFLIYSTFLGGTDTELPHSLIINNQKELFILGTTGSADFPTSIGAYDSVFNGGDSTNSQNGLGVRYDQGIDIFVSRLSADGSQLLGSTMIGGTGNDGFNFTNHNPALNTLRYNYADEVRGEIDIDENNNIYVVSCTRSTDFPTTPGAFQPTYGGGEIDGCAFKLNNSLTTLVWSSFIGGVGDDAGYSLTFDKNKDIYLVGGTTSNDLATTSDAIDSMFQGGRSDGFITHITENGSSVISSTYLGSSTYDQIYFVETDNRGKVYVLGQTEIMDSSFVKNVSWSNFGSGQFITKLSPELDTILYSTVFGSGNGINISPTAFLVDLCSKIYLSGWGGGVNNLTTLNNNAGYTFGMPITADAFQSTTDGSDIYIFVMEDDASGVSYGSYFGSPSAQEHVDGGTSRFDRKGKIYQAMCAGCGGDSNMPISPANAVSDLNRSSCNLGVFKMDFNLPIVLADFDTPPIGCAPFTYTFQNQSISQLATSYEWDFGDGSPIVTSGNPSHTYTNPGSYEVSLILTDNNTCNFGDTISKTILILGDTTYNLTTLEICPEEISQIGLLPNPDTTIHYNWVSNASLSDTAVSNPFANPLTTTTYLLLISNGVCVDSAYQTVNVNTPLLQASLDDTVCLENSNITLDANSFGTSNDYIWSSNNQFTDTLNTNTANSELDVSPSSNSVYFVQGNNNGCFIYDSVQVSISNIQTSQLTSDTICNGETVQITAANNNPADNLTYDWSLDANIISGDGTPTISVAPQNSTWFFLEATNLLGCIKLDSTFILVINDTTFSLLPLEICQGDQLEIGFSSQPHPDTSYSWNNISTLSNSFISDPIASPAVNTNYQLLINNGVCTDTVNQTVSVIVPSINGSADTVICDNSPPIIISAISTTSSNYIWSSTNAFLDTLNSDLTDPSLSVLPTTPTNYYVGVYFNGCFKYDSVLVNLASSTIQLSDNQFICLGDTIQLNATNLNPADSVSYNWENDLDIISGDGSSTINIAPAIDTWYYVEASSLAGCFITDSVLVNVSPLPSETVLATTEFDTIVLNSSSQLNVTPNGYSYLWSPSIGLNNPNISNPLASPTETTTYTVIVTDGPCTRSSFVTITVVELICGKPDVFIPNAFTPDANGKNDKVFVRGKNIKEMVFRIFDRWGELVFETTNQSEGWDGYFKGKPADPAVFVYYLDVICFDEQEYFEKGNITVIR